MKTLSASRDYTLQEEIANSLSHGVGVGLGIAALVILTVAATHQHNIWKIISGVLFGSTIVLMYLASTLYHSIPYQRTKRFFKTLDHSAIYLLIAGSYTPFSLVTLHGGWGWSFFGITWGLALLGLIFKIFFVYRFDILSTLIYVAIGWLAVIGIDPILHHLPLGGIFWLILGGCSYTLGTIFYFWEKPLYTHTIWHLFVLAGTICHFFAVLNYVIL